MQTFAFDLCSGRENAHRIFRSRPDCQRELCKPSARGSLRSRPETAALAQALFQLHGRQRSLATPFYEQRFFQRDLRCRIKTAAAIIARAKCMSLVAQALMIAICFFTVWRG